MIHRMVRIGILIAAAGAILIALGCSRAAMDANPFAATPWAGDTGLIGTPLPDRAALAEAQQPRVNLWPLYYRRGAAWSAVWPLIASSPHGHAFVPFYEFLAADHHLRLGVVHHWVPALFDVNRGQRSWRALIVERNNRTRTTNVIPFFWHNPDRTFLVPLYYNDHKGYWTPLVTNRAGITGILGPLFFRDKQEYQGFDTTYRLTQFWYPFPLWRHWREDPPGWGTQLFPLWYYSREGGESVHFNLAGILADYERKGVDHHTFKYLLPFGKIERAGDRRTNFLTPFWFYKRDAHSTTFLSWLNGYYTRNDSGERSIIHPLWYDQTSPTSRLLIAGLILYHYRRDGTETNHSVLWPLMHHRDTETSRRHMILPLYFYEHEKGGPAFFVSPLGGFKTDGSVINVLGPVFVRLNRPDGRQTAILWPLIRWWNTDRARGHSVLPLWYVNRAPAVNGRTFMTPLAGWSRSDASAFRHVLGPVYMAHDDFEDDFSWRTVLFPFFHHVREGDNTYNVLLPLLFHARTPDHRAVYSLPLSAGRKGDRKFVNVALLLAHWTASPRDARMTFLAGLIGYRHLMDDDARAWWAWPLIGWKRDGNESKFGVLLHSIGYQRDPEREFFKWWFGWFLVKYERERIQFGPAGAEVDGVLRRKFSWPLWRRMTWNRADQINAFVSEFERLASDGGVPNEFTRTLAAGQPYYLEGRPLGMTESLLRLYFRARDLKATAYLRQPGQALAPGERAAAGVDGQPVRFAFADVKESWIFPYLGYIPGLKRFGPMFYYWNDPRLGFQRRWLYGLWSSQKERGLDGTVQFERQSLLGYLYSRERDGARTSIDMFPFLSWDRDEGMKRFSFAAGLFETGRKDGRRSLKIFWIPIKKAE